MTSTQDFSHLMKPRSRARPWIYIASVSAFCAAVGLATYATKAGRAAATRQEHVEQVHARQKAAVILPSRIEQEESKRWAALTEERNFSWASVLAAIEHAIDPDVELLEFRPDKHQRSMTLRGEAKSMEALLRYLDMLAGEKALTRVYLTRASDIAHGNLATIEFEIHAAIRG